MAAALLAPLPIAPLVLVVLADLVFSLGHLDRLGLPQREGVDRAGGPAPTGGAMAVASALRIAGDFNRHSAAVALRFEGLFIVAHECFPLLECKANLDREATAIGWYVRPRPTPAARRLRGLRLAPGTAEGE